MPSRPSGRGPLADLEVVYLWVDGVSVKAGLEREKAAVLVVLAALRETGGRRWSRWSHGIGSRRRRGRTSCAT